MPNVWPVKNPPDTLVKTSHGIQIKVNGETIGAISRWDPAPYEREFNHIYELNPLSSGHPVDLVPANIRGFNITVNRYDIWKKPFEKVFGGSMSIYEALGMQERPFEVNQFLWHPDGYKELIIYRGSWMNRVGRSYNVTGDRIVMVDATLVFLRREKVL